MVSEKKDGQPTDAHGDVDAVKAKMLEALEKKNAQHHASAAGRNQVKGPNAAAAGQQRRVFRRKSG